ncbi:MAG TPA: sulfur oxidation c-type cytochrome SoxA [Thiobacillaceae bacterium]|nr:sulfur oxidation c-type cytochrome SoxA [Thiobacillaceae bacterium]
MIRIAGFPLVWGASTLLGLALVQPPALSAEPAPYREMERPLETYIPHASGDRKFSNTYRYWKDPKNLDWRLAGNPDENWKLNWKFMDPPFNQAIHGGHFALDRGESLYKFLNRGGSFAACLGAGKGGLKGLRTSYPRYDKTLKRVVGLEEKIQICGAIEGRVLENGSYDNSAISLYIAGFSKGMPMRIDVSKGPLKEAFERGRRLYHTRAGRMNFACATCHIHNVGKHLRGNTVTTPFGDVVHFPVYRTKYELQSLQLRFMECNLDTGTQPLLPGSPAYTDLEVFLSALSNGYAVTVPSERD